MDPSKKPPAPPSIYGEQRSPEMPPMRYEPPKQPLGATLKKFLGPLLVILIIGAKWIGKIKFVIPAIIKFFPMLLKTGVTMILTVGSFMVLYSWKFAVGLVLLILVHECGHVVAARLFNLKVSAPVFVPFLGAYVSLKGAPRHAWVESLVAIGGPLLGSAAAFVCIGIYIVTGNGFWNALGWTGLLLNLFNLTPIAFLDGARVMTALSPMLCAIGAALLGGMMVFAFNPFLLPILIFLAPQVFALFRKNAGGEKRYLEITAPQRVFVAVLYFGLAASLALGMGHPQWWPSPR